MQPRRSSVRVPRRSGGFAAAAMLALTLGSCGGSGPSAPTRTSDPRALVGPRWVLDTAALDVVGARGVTSSLRFDGTRVVVDDGCNVVSGTYTADATSIRIGRLAGTRRSCNGPAGDVAATVDAGLGAARTYSVSAGQLTLSAPGGTLTLGWVAHPASASGR